LFVQLCPTWGTIAQTKYTNFSQFAYLDPFLKFVYFVCAIVPHVGIFTFFFDRYSNLEVLW